MNIFAKAINVFPFGAGSKKEELTRTRLYIGVSEVNVQNDISDDMEDWDDDDDDEVYVSPWFFGQESTITQTIK